MASIGNKPFRLPAGPLLLGLVGLLGLPAGCGGGGPECGPGTTAVDGRCVPDIGACAAGTELQDGRCVPSCGEDRYWDGEACAEVPECAAGTTFDPDSGLCRPACDSGQYWDGSACVAVPDCGPGTSFDAESGGCVPDADACAPGTSLQDGRCVPDLECGPGAHVEDGQCVPDRLPDPDVPEAEVDGATAEFDPPAAGETVSLGGTVDTPVDKNEDGQPDPDWDAFAFEAEAGTWLRLEAVSEGAALPAFLIDYEETDAAGNLLWRRLALDPTSRSCQREVFLPYSGRYTISVSDYNHVAAYLYGYPTVPVGGEDFTYYVRVENLGQPEPTPLGLPYAGTDDLSDGRLGFYSVGGLTAGEVVEVTARPVVPPEAAESDVYPALLVFDDQGQLLAHYVAYGTWESAAALIHAAGGGGDYLVVRDFFLTIGAEPLVDVLARPLQPTDCDTTDCSQAPVSDQLSLLLSWELDAGDLFVAGTYFPPAGQTMIHQTLFDADFNTLIEQEMVHPAQHGAAWAYAEQPTAVYLWLRWGDGAPVGEAAIDTRTIATPAIEPDQALDGLEFHDMPPGTLHPAGALHFSGLGGKLVFFSEPAIQGGAPSQPFASLATPQLERMGPVVDTDAWNFPDGFVTPLFSYVRDDGHYLHWLNDPGGDLSAATYGLEMSTRDPEVLERPTVDQPVRREMQSPGNLRFYTFEAGRNQYVEITVEPVLLSDIQPEIWVMNFGRAVFDWIAYVWRGDPDAPQLGLVVSETAPAQFEDFTAGYVSPYDGLSIALIMDASGDAGPFDLFNIELSVPPPPDNDQCDSAEAVELGGDGQASITASNLTATDDVSDPGCTGRLAEGPDVFYRLDLQAGQTVAIELDTEEFNSALTLFTDCADPAGSCVAGSDSGRPETVEYTVPDGAGGTYRIGVDAGGRGGTFTLSVSVTGP